MQTTNQLPSDWEKSTVGKECSICNNLRFPLSVAQRETIKGKHPYYGPTGILDYINEYRVDGQYALIGEDGDHFLKYSEKEMTLLVDGKFNVNNHAHLIRGGEQCLTEWFYYYFMHHPLTAFLSRQGVARYKLNKTSLEQLPILLPPIEEQRKIAAILGDWDHTIDKLEQLLTTKRTYKRGLMQQLLSGKTRFPEFIKSNAKQKTRYSECPKDWHYLTFGDIATEYNQKNKKHEQHTVLSCTKHRGLVDSLEYFGKQVFSKDTSTYKLVERSMFAYATNHIDEGSIGYQDLTETALISPMYTVFNTDKSQVDDEYLFAALKTETYRQIFAANTNASVDRRGSLRWKDFSKIHLALPSLEEQRKIAAVLQAADAEITALEQQLKAFRQQKRGLMQQLLTGKKRVKTNKQSL